MIEDLCRDHPEKRSELLQYVRSIPTLIHKRSAQASSNDPNRQSDECDSAPTDAKKWIQIGEVLAGRYHILERVAVGGMGIVYLAEQREPIRRRVAIKVIKPGMDSHQIVARFLQEQRLLGVMDHPNIAKIFDGGMTPSELPYFVMEFVPGLRFNDFCEREHLDL